MSVGAARVLGPEAGKAGMLGSIGVRFMVGGAESAGGFSLVEHPMPPRKLAAPLHRHSREDEYSFVLEGRVGALLGDEVVYGQAGDLIFKPRGQWHTFWNAGTRRHGFWRSSLRPASSGTSKSSWSCCQRRPTRSKRDRSRSPPATGSSWISRACRGLRRISGSASDVIQTRRCAHRLPSTCM